MEEVRVQGNFKCSPNPVLLERRDHVLGQACPPWKSAEKGITYRILYFLPGAVMFMYNIPFVMDTVAPIPQM